MSTSDGDLTGRFTEPVMTEVMGEVARKLQLPSADAKLLRLTNSAVFALPSAGVVIRIARTHSLHDRVAKVVTLGRWFSTVGAPTIQLVSGVEQPVEVAQLSASVWHYLPPHDPAPTTAELGNLLRAFHQLPNPPSSLPEWDPIADARRRIGDAGGLAEPDRHTLLSWCAELAPAVAELKRVAPHGLIHGDAHVGNLLRR